MFYQLGEQLKVLNAPTAFQGLLNSLNDIMTQYKKFQGAARDAKDLAMANQFLADSLRNFADTEQTELNSAEQTAIQDAIKLNDLLTQRIELLTNEAQTEYDIMTQGVLVNQRTQAQMKITQIQQARNQANRQLEQLNQEINVTQYKVQAESHIFALASTRIALEAQLLVLQNAQTDKDLARIIALQQIVGILNSGKSLTNMDQVLAALGLSSHTAAPASNNSMGYGPAWDIQDSLNELRNRQAAGGWGPMTGYLNS